MNSGERYVDGFIFATKDDAQIAREEIKKIRYISEKMDYNHPEAILAIYNKMIQNQLFVTPVGYTFLRETQLFLLRNQEIKDEEVLDISMRTVFGERHREPVKMDAVYIQPKKPKDYKKRADFLSAICTLLVLMVLAMFAISLNSNRPNILNYERVLTDRYASWEEDLTEREAVIREKEEELLIDTQE
ncbi:MAG: hypothetical protein GX567_00310 [Clostridia bacterium]|nr:hypothetical protein [Clostridia bacterium]